MLNTTQTPMSRPQVNNLLQKLEKNLRKPVWELMQKLLLQLDAEGKASSAHIHGALFPMAETKSASAQLSKLLKEVEGAAAKAGLTLSYGFEGEKKQGASQRLLRFYGPPVGFEPDLEGLRSIPPHQIIDGQSGRIIGSAPKLLLITFNEHEHAAVNRAFLGNASASVIKDNDCLVDDLGVHGGLHVLHRFSQQGTANAQESVSMAVAAYKPRYVIACGIAFGMDSTKQRVGNVLCSEFIVPYETGRLSRGKFELRGSHPPASAKLFDWVRQLDQRQKTSPAAGIWPTLITGGLLSGDKLVDDANFRQALAELAGTQRAIGGEMEAAGVHVATRQTETPWIVIKAICDWADGHKNTPNKTDDQKLAADNAATVVKALIDTGWLKPKDTDHPPQPAHTPDDCAAFEPTHQLDVLERQQHFADQQNGRKTELRQLKTAGNPGGAAHNRHQNGENEPAQDEQVTALDYIADWACNPAEREFFALLGETGMGKTTTVQRLTQRLTDARLQGHNSLPVVYFDLRKVDVRALQPASSANSRDEAPLSISERTMQECVRNGWLSSGGRLPSLQEIHNAIDRGALVIYDGLDEVLSRIGEREGLTFTQGLLRTLEESRARQGLPATEAHASKLLITCRTQFFRSLAEQDEHLTGERRGPNQPDRFRALELLPLTDAQIRQYLHASLPSQQADALMTHIATIHNLRELAGRPFTLTLIEQFLPQIEAWKRTGQRITGALLYQQVARDWLVRDKQKQSLRLEDKETLAADLALWFSASQQRGVSALALENWLDAWLYQLGPASRYARMEREVLYEDVRNSTFLKRVDQANAPEQSRFEFAHTSLYEFFLALGLLNALRKGQRELWCLPQVSLETWTFFGQLLEAETERNKLLATLSTWRLTALPLASERQLQYALHAHQTGLPCPATAGFDLSGLDLSDWTLGQRQEPTGPAHTALFDLTHANFSGCTLRRTQFWACDLNGARFEEAELAQASFLTSRVDAALVTTANTWRLPMRWCSTFPAATDVPTPANTQISLLKSLPTVVSAGHQGEVTSCAFSPDGQWLASAGDDGTLRLWDIPTGAELRVLQGHQDRVNSCAISPDGCLLASAGMDSTLRLWETATGAELRVLMGHEGGVNSCTFSPDGRWLASAGNDSTLRLWDISTGAETRGFEGYHRSEQFNSCAFSLDGRWLVVAKTSGTLVLCNVTNNIREKYFYGHQGKVNSCVFSPDGHWLASAGNDGTVRLWDTSTGTEFRVLTGHKRGVNSCTFSPDGHLLASAGNDGTLRLWEAASGAVQHVFQGHDGLVKSCAFSTDGRWLASAGNDGTLRLWDVVSGAMLLVMTSDKCLVNDCAFSHDGRLIASVSNDLTLRLWDVTTGSARSVMRGHEDWVNSCVFSPDGYKLVTASDDCTLRLWDVETGITLRVLQGHEDAVWSCIFSPNGLLIASASNDRTLRLWDVSSGSALRVLRGHEGGVKSCAFSADGHWLVSAGHDSTVRVWDATTGSEIHVLRGHQRWIKSCAFSSDGSLLVSAGNDGTIRLWNAATGDALGTLKGHEGGVNSCAFSPDGRWLVSAGNDRTLRLWDVATGAATHVLQGHEGGVRSCMFSPNGRWLASAGYDRTLRLWDAVTGELLRTHLHAEQASASWQATGHLLHGTGRAWRYLNYQHQDADGALQIAPIEECSPWQAG